MTTKKEITPKPVPAPKPARKKNYLNNKDLYNAIVESKDAGKLTKDAEKNANFISRKSYQ